MNAWSKQPDPMSAEEHEKILKVIEQAEALERAEQERVGQVEFKLLKYSQYLFNNVMGLKYHPIHEIICIYSTGN